MLYLEEDSKMNNTIIAIRLKPGNEELFGFSSDIPLQWYSQYAIFGVIEKSGYIRFGITYDGYIKNKEYFEEIDYKINEHESILLK